MTTDEVKARVSEIADMSGYESARTADDTLRNRVLEAIAAGAENAKELAKEALKTNELRLSVPLRYT